MPATPATAPTGAAWARRRRSPSYLVRQLYDFKTGARNSVRAVLMKAVVAHPTPAQMTDIAAYVAAVPRGQMEASARTVQASRRA